MSRGTAYTPPISRARKVVLEVTPRSKIGRAARRAIEIGETPAGTFSPDVYTRALADLGAAVAAACRRGGFHK